jgi:hypothetical protein
MSTKKKAKEERIARRNKIGRGRKRKGRGGMSRREMGGKKRKEEEDGERWE